MIVFLSSILFTIFTALSGIHFYWLFGGKWGVKQAIPTKNNEINTTAVPKYATLIVALILFLFAILYLVKPGYLHLKLPNKITYAYWIIPVLFIIRGIGDFNYVGFFKKIKHTDFAKADTKWFVPLCVTIGIFGILIQIMS